QLKSNEKTEVSVCVSNKGEDLAENMIFFINFPPVFQIHSSPFYDVQTQGVEADYPTYIAAIIRDAVQHPDTTGITRISLTAPEKKEKYEIPILIYERKTGKTKCKLTIEVTD
ncbi:MAG TPA: hypothetical protein VMW84_01110, partial [Acidobacteriota bacterium]|nr:hypothetical protein [Acidobacteriota bacterium]